MLMTACGAARSSEVHVASAPPYGGGGGSPTTTAAEHRDKGNGITERPVRFLALLEYNGKAGRIDLQLQILFASHRPALNPTSQYALMAAG